MSPVTFPALLDAISHLPVPRGAQRLFHGRGGLYPGCEQWTLDFYDPVWLLTSFAAVTADELATLQAALQARWSQIAPGQPFHLVFQHRNEVQADTQVLSGEVPDPHVVEEAGTRFGVHLLRGYNHGLFLDMAEGRAWVRRALAARPSAKVLNLFAYTCAFSVVALQAGAAEVINVDMANGPLSMGKRNHQLNGLTRGANFWAHDIFNSWGKIGRHGPYDLIILDPPAYQKGSFVAEKDYPRLMRRLPELLNPSGYALLCLNSPKLGPDFLTQHMATEAPTLAFIERLPNPPAFADASSERSLKVLIYQAPA